MTVFLWESYSLITCLLVVGLLLLFLFPDILQSWFPQFGQALLAGRLHDLYIFGISDCDFDLAKVLEEYFVALDTPGLGKFFFSDMAIFDRSYLLFLFID